MLNFFKKGRRIIFELNIPSFNRSCNKSRIINIRSGNLPSTWAWSKHLSMLNFFKKKKERKGKGNLLFPDIVSRRSISTELKSIGKPYYTYRHARGRWFGEDTVQVRHDAAYAPCARLRHRSLEVRRRTWRSTSGGARTRRFCPAIRRVNRPPPSLQRSRCFQPGGNAGKINCVANFISLLFASILYIGFYKMAWKGYGYDDWLLKIGKREK